MTIIIAHTREGRVIPVILRASEADRWLAQREEAMSILGVTSVDRIDLTPEDLE